MFVPYHQEAPPRPPRPEDFPTMVSYAVFKLEQLGPEQSNSKYWINKTVVRANAQWESAQFRRRD